MFANASFGSLVARALAFWTGYRFWRWYDDRVTARQDEARVLDTVRSSRWNDDGSSAT